MQRSGGALLIAALVACQGGSRDDERGVAHAVAPVTRPARSSSARECAPRDARQYVDARWQRSQRIPLDVTTVAASGNSPLQFVQILIAPAGSRALC